MRISYVSRSKFLILFTTGILYQGDRLSNGETIEIQVEAGGYGGKVEVELTPTHTDEFNANWNGADPTRFPARIRAVATALRDCGFAGRS